jgi:hypothetical protein
MKKFLTLLLLFVASLQLYSEEATSKGKFSGYMFGDYFYNSARDTAITKLPNVANGGAKNLNGFQLRRIYFTYDYDISSSFTTKFRLEADQAANTSNGKIGVMVKDAYLQWKNIFSGSDLIFGIQPTPSFDVSEGVWGNRFLEKTILDLRGIAPSRDIGISLKGKIDGEGMFKYWVMYGNGSGNAPETDKYKRFYAHIQYNPIKQFTATLYADLNQHANIPSLSNPQETVSNNDITYDLFLAYKEKDAYSFGLEAFTKQSQNGFVDNGNLTNKNTMGISVFASYDFSKDLSTVVRYDYFDPNSSSNSKGDSRNWFLLSLNYKPYEKVTISPNVIVETYEAIPNGRSIDASVTPRLTFFYIF